MTNQYFLDRIAGRGSNLRAADADRERVAERLRQSHAEGRLDMAELQERLERCYEAKTFGQLDELVRDLPRQDQDAQRSLGSWRAWAVVPLLPILIVLLIVLAVAGGHHGHHLFWLWIPVLFLVWRMSWWRRRRWFAAGRRGPGGWI